MAISQVSKFHIFAHLSIKEFLLKELQKLGCAEIIHIGKKTSFHDWKNIEEDNESSISAELNKVKFCIDLLSNYKEEEKKGIKSLVSSKETMNYDHLVEIAQEFDYEKLYQQCKELDTEFNHLKLQENRLKAVGQEIRDWQEVEIDLSRMNQTKYVRYLLGSIPKSDLTYLVRDVEHQGKINIIQPIKEDKNRLKIIIITLKENIEEINHIVQQYHFEVYKYSYSLTGTPKQILKDILDQLTEITGRREEIEKDLIKLYKNNTSIYPIYDFLSISKEKEDANKHLKKSENTFVIKGWIQKRDIPKLQNRLKNQFTTYEINFTEPKEDEKIPVALDNHQLVQPFEVITELYSLPSYHEIDPTPTLSIFYFIFFGLCLSDVGYGATMAILSYLAIHKLRLEGTPKKFFTLLYYCGIAGILGGIFVGSWFGDILDYLPPFFSSTRDFLIQRLALFEPTDNPIPLLILSLALGIIQVFTGIILKFLDNVRKGELADGFMDQISWLFLLTGLILVLLQGMAFPALGKFPWFFLLVGVFSIILTHGRNNKNIFMRLGSGILALYSITGYFSDVLSYSRLFALGLATGIIAKMFNMLAAMVDVPYIGFFLTLIILFIGHAFNLLISGLSAFIHDARLQYVEFFTKFYQAGGNPFRPFSFKTTYTKVEENKK